MNLLVLRAGLYHGLSHHPQPGEDLRPGLPRRLHLPNPARGSGHGRVIIILQGVTVYILYIVHCTKYIGQLCYAGSNLLYVLCWVLIVGCEIVECVMLGPDCWLCYAGS